jgi:septum site-determining protein MinD
VKTFRDWTLIADIPAGPRQVGAGFAAFASTYLVVVEPSWPSALAGRRVARVARARSVDDLRIVASKVAGEEDLALVEELMGEAPFASVPLDEAVARAEREGTALLDAAPDSEAARAIGLLADRLTDRLT